MGFAIFFESPLLHFQKHFYGIGPLNWKQRDQKWLEEWEEIKEAVFWELNWLKEDEENIPHLLIFVLLL